LPKQPFFFSGENNWYKLGEWPPKEKKDQVIFLQPQGRLGWTKPAASTAFTEYTSDPARPVPYTEDVHMRRTVQYMTDDQRFASRRPDVAVFETEILTEDLTLAGTVMADVLVSTTGTDVDLVVKVIDVFPNDFEYKEKSNYPMVVTRC